MKTNTLLAAAAILAVGGLAADAQVYSQNIVGYVNQVLNPSAYTMITCPVGASSTNVVENVMPCLQQGDQVFIWTGGGYNDLTYFGPNFDGNGNTWADANGNGVVSPTFAPGQALFYVNGQNGIIETNTFVGTVILTNSVDLNPSAYQMVGSTVPIAVALDDTNLALPFQQGDQVFLWTGGGYNDLTYFGPNFDGNGNTFADVNGNGVASPTIQVGQGFFYLNGQNGVTESWVQNFNVQ